MIAKDVIVYFRVPETFKDYVKQTKRSIRVQVDIRQLVNPQLVAEYMTMNLWVKARAFLTLAARTNPLVVVSYVVLQCLPHLLSLFGKEKTMWDAIESTKKVQ